jgi:hypothetical protein
MDQVQPLEVTTVETDGRVYSGAGVDETSIEQALSQTSFGQKVEAEPEKADPSTTVETRGADGKFVSATSEPVQDAPKETRGARRFSHLTSERDKEKARADAAEARSRELEAKLNAPPAAKVEPPIEQARTEPSAPDLTEPTFDEFANDPDPLNAYIKARDAFLEKKIEAKLDAQFRERIEAERASRQFGQTVADTWERGRRAYADFDAVLSDANVIFPRETLRAIAHAPDSEHLQYALASDPALSQRIAALTDPVAIGYELGRAGSARGSAPPASPIRAATTKAPPPYQPVSGASRTANPSPDELATHGRYDEYKAARHAQMGVKVR